MNGIFKVSLCCLALLFTVVCEDSYGQRGRGGGGGRGGGRSMSRGSGGGGRNFSRQPSKGRSPSMSRPSRQSSVNRPSSRPSAGRPSAGRPSARPSRPSAGRPSAGRPSTGRPSQGQLNNFLDLDRPGGTRPSTRPATGASGFLQNNRPPTAGVRPSGPNVDRPGSGNRPGVDRPGVGNRPGNRPGLRPPGNRPPGYRPPGARPPGYRPPGYRPPGRYPGYGAGYWAGHRHYHWGWYNHSNNWWKWATAATVTGWVTADWITDQPIYYDYGTTVYYEGDNVYSDGEVVATADEYAEQAQTIANSVPDVEPDAVEWMPLGVFALAEKDATSAADSTMFLQLAISKEGIIAGTFQNKATDASFEVEGTIDDKSQRAAWGPVGKDWPIMETGIYNLTENESNSLLHFDDGQTQEWTMFRLDEPEDVNAALLLDPGRLYTLN